MATKASPPAHKVADTGETPEHDHAAWKQAKVERGLTQAEDRASLIPAEKVWRDLAHPPDGDDVRAFSNDWPSRRITRHT